MNALRLVLFTASAFLVLLNPCHADTPSETIKLNNEGVKALNAEDWQRAFQNFAAALKLDSEYKLPRGNLSIAHNNYGLHLMSQPDEALKQFHQALLWNMANDSSRQNIERLLKKMGLNPSSFEDRVSMAEKAFKAGDYVGATVEYSEALKLQDNVRTRDKLDRAYKLLDEIDHIVDEDSLLPEPKAKSYHIFYRATPPSQRKNKEGSEDSRSWTESDADRYVAELQKRIRQVWFPPVSDKSRHIWVDFEIEKNGQMKKLRLLKYSGSTSADQAAMNAVRNASPFNPLPDAAPESVSIQFTFDYNVFGKTRRSGPASMKRITCHGFLPSLAR